MRGKRRTVVLKHLIGIAVIRGDERPAAHLFNSGQCAAQAGINRFNRLAGCLEHTCVADHVAVGIIKNNYVVFSAFNASDHFVSNSEGAHFRLHIIRRDLRRRDQCAVLAGIRFLDAAVEKEGYVRIFLRLGDAKLRHAFVGDIFAECIRQA